MITRVLKFLFIVALITRVGDSFADNVTLAWNPSTDPTVVSYNLYYGAASHLYTGLVQAGRASSVTISNLIPQVTYYFAATAVDITGLESGFSDEISYTIPQSILAPSITLQPSNQTVFLGSNVQFLVSVAGTAPLNFQWVFNGSPLQGATASTLNLTNVQLTQSGTYAVLVTNIVGATSSAPALLTVQQPTIQQAPIVTFQPSSQTVVVGSNAQFQVSAEGTTPLSYQWMFNGSPLGGATISTLNLTNVQLTQSGTYAVLVTNIVGATSSAPVLLTVVTPPSITTQPVDQTVVAGSDVTFSVAVDGTGALAYQWFFNGTNLIATGSTLSLTNVQPSQAGFYSVVVTNMAGSITSSLAQLAVLMPPFFTLQPSSQTVAIGSSVEFQSNAGGTPPLGYQWFLGGVPIPSGTNSVLALTDLQPNQAGTYLVTVTNRAGSSTSQATLTILVPPTITKIVSDGATVSLSLDSVEGLEYELDYNDALNSGIWTSLSLPVLGTGTLITLQDTNASGSSRFYRIRCY